MKKILSLILALLLMLAMVACGGNETAEPTETKAKTDVAEPMTWDQINAIPLADDSMTEEQLRQIVLDYMRLQLTFAWTPSHVLGYNNAGSDITLLPGKIYGGLPYDNGCYGNIYTMMEFYDSDNGMFDLTEAGKTLQKIANQCSSSCCWAWGRVCNTLTNDGATDSTQNNGYIPVGNYKYEMPPANNNRFNDAYSSYMVCVANGIDVMCESYALLKPADGLVQGAHNGHIRMVSATPVVVRNADGSINPEQSYLTYYDQGRAWWTSTQSNGVPYEIQGGVDAKTSFLQLFNSGYIPVTFAEFLGTDPVEKSETKIDYTSDSVTIDQLFKATVSSNYWISDVTVIVKDSKGNEVYKYTNVAYNNGKTNEVKVAVAMLKTDMQAFADGKHTVEVSSRISTGEKPVVYTGTLTG